MAEELRLGPPSWADLKACNYCRHYVWVGTHGASPYCHNKESPFYDHTQPEWIGTDLTFEQSMRGCEKLDYGGQKIHPLIFKLVPKDSQLRRLPLESVVEGFSTEMNLDTDRSTEEMAELYKSQAKIFDEMLSTYGALTVKDGKLVPASSEDKVQIRPLKPNKDE